MTGCVYSKFSNFVVTAGTDCAGIVELDNPVKHRGHSSGFCCYF